MSYYVPGTSITAIITATATATATATTTFTTTATTATAATSTVMKILAHSQYESMFSSTALVS